jgi:hypothetical protein
VSNSVQSPYSRQRCLSPSSTCFVSLRLSWGAEGSHTVSPPWVLLLYIVTAQPAIDVSTSAKVRHAHHLLTSPSHLIFPLMLPSFIRYASGATSATPAIRATNHVSSTYSSALQASTLPLLVLSLPSLLHPLHLPPLQPPHRLRLSLLHLSPLLFAPFPTSPTPL